MAAMNAPSRDNLPVAFAMMMLGVALVASMDTIAKILTETVPLTQVVWGRFFFHAVFLAPAAYWLARRTPLSLTRKSFLGHGARGVLLLLSTVFYFAAIRDNPIPDAIAVFFIEPILVMFMAAIFLGEPLRRRRLLAGLVAFGGVMIVLRPGSGAYQPTILFSLLAAFSFGGYIIFTRASSVRGSPLLLTWGTGLAGLLCVTPFTVFVWQPPNVEEWLLLGLMGIFAAGGHWAIAAACRLANASLVALFHYSEIMAAAIISYFVFAHIPDYWVWVGFAFIASAKIVVTLLEVREKRQGQRRNHKPS